MIDRRKSHWKLGAAAAITLVALSLAPTTAGQQAPAAPALDNDDLGGVVTGPKGPEAGVWVIAETTDLPTKFAKIVVTDDRGRYVVPDLPHGELQRLGARLRPGGFAEGARRAGQAAEPDRRARARRARGRGVLSGGLLVFADAACPTRTSFQAPARPATASRRT